MKPFFSLTDIVSSLLKVAPKPRRKRNACSYSICNSALPYNLLFPDPRYENTNQWEAFAALDAVDFTIPSQAEAAAYIASKFFNTYRENEDPDKEHDEVRAAIFSFSDFPRTEEQRKAYERTIIIYRVASRLIGNKKPDSLVRAKYLSRSLVRTVVCSTNICTVYFSEHCTYDGSPIRRFTRKY